MPYTARIYVRWKEFGELPRPIYQMPLDVALEFLALCAEMQAADKGEGED